MLKYKDKGGLSVKLFIGKNATQKERQPAVL